MANLYNHESSKPTSDQGYNPRTISSEIPVKVNGFGKFIWYLLFIFIVPIFIHIKWVNEFKRRQLEISNNASLIDTQLASRAQKILRMVESVSSHMRFEKDIMTQVAQYRSAATKVQEQSVNTDGNISAEAMEARQNLENQTAPLLTRFMAQFEAYPELKSAELVKDLNEQIVECENNIASARRLYNSNATIFNQEIFSYPKSVTASSMKLTTILLFQAKESDRQDISAKLY
ncbi:LemA family protein [Mycoplasmopsis caviae]|uniref:LemA family n=2 Tax=Mycoplasmopsis caviae TaxID=55603 RepID=A0A3P8KNB5_9BACT|nr:LemA family protein [Mycoplasmopsis caviae]UUD34770.1 LemA family protein [Mycoplasmopsis caviae]VDR42368.1 LemA family [Mycoplasmopsis caviae]